jgi:tetratricopeptide (TPR) repeat protein
MGFRARAFVGTLLVGTVCACSGSERDASPKAAHEKIALAVQEVAYVNLDKALRYFGEAKALTQPGSDEWQEALFGEATSVWHLLPIQRENADRAAALFTELVTRVPESRFAPRALMNLGRILELPEDRDDPIDLPGARAWYQKVVDQWPGDAIAGEATLRIAGTYIQTYDDAEVRRGVSLLRSWAETHAADPLASIMWEYLASTYFFPLKDYGQSLYAYEKVDALGWTEKGLQGKYYWRIAQMSDRFLHNRDAAVKYYTKIIEETPNSGKAYESELALRRLGAPVPQSPLLRFLGAHDTTATPIDQGGAP